MMLALSYFFEITVIVMSLFWLYGKKVRITIPVVGIIAIYMVFFANMVIFDWNHMWSILIYLAIFIFCKLEFNSRLKATVGYNILMLLILGGNQILIASILELLPCEIQGQELYNFIINISTFLIVYVLYKKVNIHDVLNNMRFNNTVVKGLLVAIIGIGIAYFIYAKANSVISGSEYLMFFLLAIVIVFLAGTWEQYRIKAHEKEMELRTHELYAATYQKLIDTIRVRQHEYDNHIHTIINLRYTYDTYEDLKNAQMEYMDALLEDNKHTKLLSSGNKTFIAFLYGKILLLEEAGIQCEYKIKIEQLDAEMPVYKMIEIVNNLIANAQDAVESNVQNERVVKIIAYENDDTIHFEVWNYGDPISSDYISKCFKKGVSSKGKGRGLGLYNIKRICKKYSADVMFENRMSENRNWVCFIIKIPKSS